MKKIFTLLLLLFAFHNFSKSQSILGNWDFGFGINSIRFMGDVNAEKLNFGANAYLQRNLTEKASFRLKFDFNHFTAHQNPVINNNYSLNLEYVLKIFPSDPIVPYIGAGFGLHYYNLSSPTTSSAGGKFGEIAANVFFGAYFDWFKNILGENWKLKGEFSQHTISSDQFDGLQGPGGGFFGGTLDSYIQFDFGLLCALDKVEKPVQTSLPTGVTQTIVNQQTVDLSSIENKLNKIQDELNELKNKPVQTQVTKAELNMTEVENLLKKYQAKPTEVVASCIVLDNLYFDSNKAVLDFDSYKDLVENLQTLLNNVSLKVDIQGHTDDLGNTEENKKLSQKRADFVKNFLVSQGVDASRLTASAFGASKPLSSDKTDDGRKLNRRVEFKIVK